MDLNLTLLGEIITFLVLVWFTMKFVWPPIVNAIEARQQKIAEGLAAAERGKKELSLAQEKISIELKTAKVDAAKIVDHAHRQAAKIIEETNQKAKEKNAEFLALAKSDLEREVELARNQLEQDAAALVIASIKKVLEQRVDSDLQNALLEKFIREL